MKKLLYCLLVLIFCTKVRAVESTNPNTVPGIGEQAINTGPSATVDRLIAKKWSENDIIASKVCSDRVFVRRIHLDLIGRIPAYEELTRFLENSSESKRTELVDRLLQSKEYARHFADVLDVVLMGRGRSSKMDERARHGWRKYLEDSFASNRPWDAMARDMILARATDTTDVRAGWYLYERKNNHQEIAEAIAPSLLGIRVECAQCHDHPIASEITQAHYWGLVAFFSRGKNQNTKAGPRVVESAIGGFRKYTDLAGENFDAELTFFKITTIPEAKPDVEQKESDDLYLESVGTEPRVPKFSRRQQFVNHVLPNHPMFARAFVNRIWALLMGRGFVHPVDRMDSAHEPSHPELLEALAKHFSTSKFDIQQLVRGIVLSDTYQLDSVPAKNQRTEPSYFAHGLEKPITAESYLRSMVVATNVSLTEPDTAILAEFRKRFGALFAETATTDMTQAMYLTNNQPFNAMLGPRCQLIDAMMQRSDSNDRIRFAFESVFGRLPAADELNAANRFLSSNNDRSHMKELIWAMLTSAEFRFNH